VLSAGRWARTKTQHQSPRMAPTCLADGRQRSKPTSDGKQACMRATPAGAHARVQSAGAEAWAEAAPQKVDANSVVVAVIRKVCLTAVGTLSSGAQPRAERSARNERERASRRLPTHQNVGGSSRSTSSRSCSTASSRAGKSKRQMPDSARRCEGGVLDKAGTLRSVRLLAWTDWRRHARTLAWAPAC
jgi:hypothetical protein